MFIHRKKKQLIEYIVEIEKNRNIRWQTSKTKRQQDEDVQFKCSF